MTKLRCIGAAAIMALFLTLALFTTGAFAQSAQVAGSGGCGTCCSCCCSTGCCCGASWLNHVGSLGCLGIFNGCGCGGFDISRFGSLGCLGIF